MAGDIDYEIKFTGTYGTYTSATDSHGIYKIGAVNIRIRRNSPKTATIILERNTNTGQIDEGDICEILLSSYQIFYGEVITIDEVSESLTIRFEVEDKAAKAEDIYIFDQLYVNSAVADKKLFNVGLAAGVYTSQLT